MAATKRSQNKCKSCGYTWYPRGKAISLKCPRCGSNEVGYAGGVLGVGALLVFAVLAFDGNKESQQAKNPSNGNTSAVSQHGDTSKPGEARGAQSIADTGPMPGSTTQTGPQVQEVSCTDGRTECTPKAHVENTLF